MHLIFIERCDTLSNRFWFSLFSVTTQINLFMRNNKLIRKSLAEAYQAVAPVMAVGWVFTVSVVITAALGVWIDRTFHTSPLFFLTGAILGIALGIYNLIITIRELNEKKKK
jgi:F0F1-type ATP synthase assembly protein I